MRSTHRDSNALGAGAIVLPIAGAALVLFIAAGAAVVVPQFQTMFAGFGADLPASTRLLLATYRGWALAVLPVAVVWLCVPGPRARAVTALLTGAFIAAGLMLFGLWACYAPILGLAALTK